MGVEIHIQGVDELNAILAQLPPELYKKVMVPGLRKAAKPLIESMRSKVPVLTGQGKRSIGVVTAKGIEPAVLVGPRTGKGTKDDGWYLRFIEFGTTIRTPRQLGRRARKRGKKQSTKLKFTVGGRTLFVDYTAPINPHPFVRPAFDETHQKVGDLLGDHVGKAVKRYFAKHGKKIN